MEEEGRTVEALYIENDQIVKTGTLKEILSSVNEAEVEMVDCEGKIGLPGFIDSHMHLIGHGEAMKRVNLANCHSYEEMIDRMKNAASNARESEWIIGEGWNENEWVSSKHSFFIEDLDSLSSSNPIVLKRTCRHVYFVNSLALQLAEIDENSAIDGGQVGLSEKGIPNGLLYDEAVNLILKAMPSPDKIYLSDAIETAIKDCYRHGIVAAVTEDLSYYGNANLVVDLYEELLNDLPFHVHVLIQHTTLDEVAGRLHSGNQNVSFGGVKAFIDGSFGGRTALLETPYQDDPSTNGLQVTSPSKLDSITKKARQNGLPIAFHMIGDLAVKQGIEAVKNNVNNGELPDRFIHCELLSPTLIEEMKELHIVVDVQTSFLYGDYPWLIDRVGEDRNKYAFLIKTLLDKNIHLANGSDTPIDSVNPWQGIYTSVTRKAKDGIVYNQQEAISRFEAIKLYTTSSASSFAGQNKRGLIKEGYAADFILFNQDPFQVSDDELLLMKCCETICRGKNVYKIEN